MHKKQTKTEHWELQISLLKADVRALEKKVSMLMQIGDVRDLKMEQMQKQLDSLLSEKKNPSAAEPPQQPKKEIENDSTTVNSKKYESLSPSAVDLLEFLAQQKSGVSVLDIQKYYHLDAASLPPKQQVNQLLYGLMQRGFIYRSETNPPLWFVKHHLPQTIPKQPHIEKDDNKHSHAKKENKKGLWSSACEQLLAKEINDNQKNHYANLKVDQVKCLECWLSRFNKFVDDCRMMTEEKLEMMFKMLNDTMESMFQKPQNWPAFDDSLRLYNYLKNAGKHKQEEFLRFACRFFNTSDCPPLPLHVS